MQSLAHTAAVPEDLDRRLRSLAKRMGIPAATLMRQILKRGLTDLEDYCDAAEILQRVRSGKETTFSSMKMRQELGI